MSLPNPPGSETATRRRRWPRRLAIASIAAILVVALAPTLVSFAPVRRAVLAVVPTRVHGTISAGAASFGWFSGPKLDDLEIRSDAGETLLSVPHVELDRPLWRLACAPSDLGAIRAERARLRLLLTDQGSNLEDVLGIPIKLKRSGQDGERQVAPAPAAPASAPAPRPAPHIHRQLDFRLVDASVVWRTPEAAQEWSVEHINLALGLRPAWSTASGFSEVLVERGKVLDHCQLSPGMCNDVLKYVAPILSKVTRAEGEISIDLDDWRLPLGHPDRAELSGRLSLHNVDVGPGPFVSKLAEALHVPPDVAMARESIVSFQMTGGRIEHRDLAFDLPGVHVRTSGSVGLDRTLDLVAEVELRLPDKLLAESPLAKSLAEKSLKIPIGGTLSKPQLEAGFVRDLGLAKLFDKLQNLGLKLPGGKAAAEASTQDADGKLLSQETVELLEELLGKWGERRRAKQDDRQPQPESAEPSEKQRPLEKLRDRLRRARKGDAQTPTSERQHIKPYVHRSQRVVLKRRQTTPDVSRNSPTTGTREPRLAPTGYRMLE